MSYTTYLDRRDEDRPDWSDIAELEATPVAPAGEVSDADLVLCGVERTVPDADAPF